MNGSKLGLDGLARNDIKERMARVHSVPGPEENSGLHEIKALASSTKQRISQRAPVAAPSRDLDAISTSGLMPVVLPDPRKERRSSVSQAVGSNTFATRANPALAVGTSTQARPAPHRKAGWVLGGLLVVAGSAGAAYLVVQMKPAPVAATAAPVAPTPTPTPAAIAAAPVEENPPAPAVAPLPSPEPTVAPLAVAETPRRREETPTARPSAPPARAATPALEVNALVATAEPRASKADKAAPEARPTEQAKAAAKGGESIDDILDQVATAGTPEAAVAAAKAEAVKPDKKALDRRDVSTAMGKVRGEAGGCYGVEQFSGTVSVKFSVDPTGKVTSAKAVGAHASTPTGTCVADAVKGARFPAFDGVATSFTFPFLLSE